MRQDKVTDALKRFTPKTRVLTIRFDNQKACEHFKSWMCGSGEQSYWDQMEYRECEDDGNITATHFDYHKETDSIIAKCGRLDDGDV